MDTYYKPSVMLDNDHCPVPMQRIGDITKRVS